MLRFITIDINKHSEVAIGFRKDSFAASFGNASGFGDEKKYLNWLEIMVKDFPDGFVMVEKDNRLIGQLELTIKEYKDRKIGYVNLYYLVPEIRGNGVGKELHKYACSFFRSQNLNEFHLRVSPTNTSALKFYQKLGMEEIGQELDGEVIRMKGFL